MLPPGPGNYEIGSTLRKKTTAIFGNELRPGLELNPKLKVPGPGAYASPSDVGLPNNPHYGFSKSPKGYKTNKAFEVPGPGAYAPLVKVGKEGTKYSLYGRTQYNDKNKLLSPGPAAYSPNAKYIEEKPNQIQYSIAFFLILLDLALNQGQLV
jgi:hypothetical protein